VLPGLRRRRLAVLFAITRDLAPGHPLGRTGTNATPAAAAVVVCGTVFAMGFIDAVFFGAKPFERSSGAEPSAP
jgi:hypothetical protein